MAPLLFARLKADVELEMRRGAWYRVLEHDDLQAVLDVNHQRVGVLKAWLEIQPRPPLQWSIVSSPPGSRKVPRELGQAYVVCPNCRGRSPLPKRGNTLQCRRCREEFELETIT